MMEGDGNLAIVLRWLGGGWGTSERNVQTLEVIQIIWGSLPLTRTEAAIARGDCFA